MLADFGLAASEYHKARAALFEWEIIRKTPHRKNIAAHKADFARAVLEDAFLWHCNNGECRQAAARDESAASNAAAGNAAARPLLLVAQSVCSVCGGDPSASVLAQAGQALAAAGVRRILIVGGTERKERELRQKSPSRPGLALHRRQKSPGRPLLSAPPRLGPGHHHLAKHPPGPQGLRTLRRQRRPPRHHRPPPRRHRRCPGTDQPRFPPLTRRPATAAASGATMNAPIRAAPNPGHPALRAAIRRCHYATAR